MANKLLQLPSLAIVAQVSYLLPLLAGWIRYKKLSKDMMILLGLFSFYIPVFVLNFYLMFEGKNSVWLDHIDSLVEFVLVSIVFSMWSKNKVARGIIRASIAIYGVVWIIAKLSFERITLYNTFTGPLAEMFLVAFAVYTLIALLGEQTPSLLYDSRAWVSVAIILYGVGTIPVFAVANNLLQHPLEVFAQVWAINWTLSIVENTMFAVAFFAGRPN